MNELTYADTGARSRIGAPKRRSRSLRRKRALKGNWTTKGTGNSSSDLFVSWAF